MREYNVCVGVGRIHEATLYLRAVSEQWTIERHDIALEKTIGEGEEGVVYKGSWRMMPVVAKVNSVCVLQCVAVCCSVLCIRVRGGWCLLLRR